ncbi:MAG: glycosyltransferase [Candidatus Velthaea sp.]
MKIAVFDDFVPHLDLGAGLPRANALVNELAQRCERVAYFAMHGPAGETTPEQWYRDIDRRVEISIPPLPYDWTPTFEGLRAGGFDVLWISRPPNMRTLLASLIARPDLRAAFTIVYDAEALYAPRSVQLRRLEGRPVPPEIERGWLEEEFFLARQADLVVSVSPGEAHALREGTQREAFVLGFTSLPDPTPASFAQRRDFGFVGPLRRVSPNEDSLLWYGANVLHEVAARTQARLRVAGALDSRLFAIYAGPQVELLGKLDDLRPFFNAMRVFIAPTRFAAGLPQKLIDAASAGVPIVATSLLAEELGWTHRTELLVADDAAAFADACVALYTDADLWQQLRETACRRIAQAYGTGCFARELDVVLGALMARPPRCTEPART